MLELLKEQGHDIDKIPADARAEAEKFLNDSAKVCAFPFGTGTFVKR